MTGTMKGIRTRFLALAFLAAASTAGAATPHKGYLVMQGGRVMRAEYGLMLPLRDEARLDGGGSLKLDGELSSGGRTRKLVEGQMIDWTGRDVGVGRAFLAGVKSGLNSRAHTTAQESGVIALVGEKPLLYSVYAQRVRGYREALERKQPNAKVDVDAIKKEMLKQLLVDEMLCAKAEEWHLSVDQGEVDLWIENLPQTQRDGRFDLKTYKAYLATRGIDREEYEYGVGRFLTAQKVSKKFVSDARTPAQGIADLNAYIKEASARTAIQTFPETAADDVVGGGKGLKIEYAELPDPLEPAQVRAWGDEGRFVCPKGSEAKEYGGSFSCQSGRQKVGPAVTVIGNGHGGAYVGYAVIYRDGAAGPYAWWAEDGYAIETGRYERGKLVEQKRRLRNPAPASDDLSDPAVVLARLLKGEPICPKGSEEKGQRSPRGQVWCEKEGRKNGPMAKMSDWGPNPVGATGTYKDGVLDGDYVDWAMDGSVYRRTQYHAER